MLYTIYIHTPHIANNWRLHAGVISYEAIPGELSMNLRLRRRTGKIMFDRIHHPHFFPFFMVDIPTINHFRMVYDIALPTLRHDFAMASGPLSLGDASSGDFLELIPRGIAKKKKNGFLSHW